ncbi:MAG: rhamnogalacturonan lyase [Polyangiaceae bacterium]
MKRQLRSFSASVLGLSVLPSALVLAACGSSTTPSDGQGGKVSAGGSGQGGVSGGATNSSGGSGQGGASVASGGATSGGAQAGGATSGGTSATNGGAQTGGAAPASGGTSAGGSSAGTSPANGGSSSGGSTASGGSSAGGTASTGGSAGSGTGGATQGTCPAPPTTGHYQMEDLDRGVVAVKVSNGVYVSWRMMGYEYDKTTSNVSYNLYRDGTKVANVTDSTNYLDAAGATSSSYSVSAVIKGVECAKSAGSTPWAQNYISIPLTPPATGPNGGTYSANDASVGDLDGDGKLDIVLKWDPSNSKDNSQSGVVDDVFLDGYTLAGQRLFRIDLGPNIRGGAHYTQFSVGDFDGDGKAEVACKTAPGTKDGTGAYLSKGPAASDTDSSVYRNSDGYVLTGPEYLTVFEGKTGKELATIAYAVPRGTVSSWGDSYGNRVDRFNGGMAFVSDTGSGKTATGRPSIIQGRGYYTRLTVQSYNYRSGALTKNWVYDSVSSLNADGAGDHSEMAIDGDGDGAQEIVTGAATIGSEGTLRCQTNMGHGDALHVGELVVGKPPAAFTVHEGVGGYDVHDVATCKFYVKVTGGGDNGRGVAEYIQASNTTGAALWSSLYSDLYSCVDGSSLGSKPGPTNFLIYWDADEPRELLDNITISKFGGGTLLSCADCASNNTTKATPTLSADLFGDWREEIVWRQSDNKALRIYTTTAVTKRRIYTLMHDPTYRAQVSFEQSAYNQPPHVGFHIGAGMAAPPVPDIRIVPR